MTPRRTLHLFFFFNDTATTEIYTLSLHDALPISNIPAKQWMKTNLQKLVSWLGNGWGDANDLPRRAIVLCYHSIHPVKRSEEHTSELQSRLHLVCRLLLEKKKKMETVKMMNHHAY